MITKNASTNETASTAPAGTTAKGGQSVSSKINVKRYVSDVPRLGRMDLEYRGRMELDAFWARVREWLKGKK